MNEIDKLVKTLGISIDEAKQLIIDDKEVDRMTSVKELTNDLTEEQKKAVKKARQSERTKTVYNFDTSKRKRAENPAKREIIENLRTALADMGCDDIEITNVERELVFHFNDIKYKVTLSAPRK